MTVEQHTIASRPRHSSQRNDDSAADAAMAVWNTANGHGGTAGTRGGVSRGAGVGNRGSRDGAATDEIVCFHCRKPGHKKPDCPNLTPEQKKEYAERAAKIAKMQRTGGRSAPNRVGAPHPPPVHHAHASQQAHDDDDVHSDLLPSLDATSLSFVSTAARVQVPRNPKARGNGNIVFAIQEASSAPSAMPVVRRRSFRSIQETSSAPPAMALVRRSARRTTATPRAISDGM